MNLKIREIFHDHAMDAIYHFILIYVVHFNGLYSNGYYRETIGVDMETKDILYEDNIVDSSIQSTSIACMRHCKRLSQTCYNFGYNEETRQCHLYDVLSMTGQTKHEQGWRYTAMGDTKEFICPSTWLQGGSECFKFSVNQDVIWHDAVDECVAMGGYLAEPETNESNTFLMDYGLNTVGLHYFWIGGSDELTKGVWMWNHTERYIQGNDISPFWAKDEPTKLATENCMVLMAAQHNDRGWHDAWCGHTGKFVCEIDAFS